MTAQEKKKAVAMIMAEYQRDVAAIEADLDRAVRKILEKVNSRKVKELQQKIKAL